MTVVHSSGKDFAVRSVTSLLSTLSSVIKSTVDNHNNQSKENFPHQEKMIFESFHRSAAYVNVPVLGAEFLLLISTEYQVSETNQSSF